MLQQAIGLSILLGFLSTELLGLFTGGLVSAGYLAFFMEQPYRILSTIVLALVVYGLTKLIGRVVILYGRRRFMLTVLLGILLGWLYEKQAYYFNGISQDLRIIGYMIPGLLANDMCKQGIWRTVLMVLVIALLIGGTILRMHTHDLGFAGAFTSFVSDTFRF